MRRITLKQVKATNTVFTRLNNLRRWTEFNDEGKYDELAKQAFNCIIAYMLAKCAEDAGKNICYENFPRIAIGRAYAKVYVYFDTPEHKIEEICKLSGISKKAFDVEATKIIAEITDDEFAEFLSKGIGEYEVRIYKAATKIATYIELLEQQVTDFSKLQEIERDLEMYMDIPCVEEFSDTDSPVFKVWQEVSKLRNQNRWATCCYNVECSVLGHLFDTAIFAYMIALEESDFDEEYATRMFFLGIFHDVAETWTKDIPSTIKNRIPGFRKATEKYELQKLEKHMYTKVPAFLKEALKSVMMEDSENESFKKKLKEADYLSADSECYRNLFAGSRDTYFCDAIVNHDVENCSPNYIAMHQFFVNYANKVRIEDEE